MKIRLYKPVLLRLTTEQKKFYKLPEDAGRYDRDHDLDITQFSKAKCLDLRNLLLAMPKSARGASVAANDIMMWLTATKDYSKARPRNVSQFTSLLTQLVGKVPGYRVVEQDLASGVVHHYYVSKIEYHPPRHQSGGGMSPPQCEVELMYREFGKLEERTLWFYNEDVRGRSVLEALAEKHFLLETPEARARYLHTLTTRYDPWHNAIGQQFIARGQANDDLDGNPKADRESWWGRRVHTIQLEKAGEPSRVIIDVFREDPEDRNGGRGRGTHFDARWWYYQEHKLVDDAGDVDDEEDLIEARAQQEEPELTWEEPEVPIHFTVAVFDLKKHLRLQLHIEQLEPYQYDTTIGGKLVMPTDERRLIDILLAHKAEFNDVISGKGGGAIVLCTGAPGLGKTLTAEVYAEVSQRPLYTVQCSQLGIRVADLEDNLLRTFARAERWNAILLLDEADVYVAPRGSDLVQNAIVGVFLRTLEYYRGVMFLTTNRPDLVDDAIASRCLARIDYGLPSVADQIKIWDIQCALNGATLSPKQLRAIAEAHPELSGRDVKGLLKLALMIHRAEGRALDPSLIDYAKKFKPTHDVIGARRRPVKEA